jgi:hypothetical protein
MQSGWLHQHFDRTYCCHTSIISRKVGMALGAFQQKMLGVIYRPIQENTLWSIQYNMTSSSCFKVLIVVTNKMQRKGMGWTIAVRPDREMGGWMDRWIHG